MKQDTPFNTHMNKHVGKYFFLIWVLSLVIINFYGGAGGRTVVENALTYTDTSTTFGGMSPSDTPQTKERQKMSMLKVIETWEARLPAEPEREIPTKNGGVMKFPALKERTVLMSLLEAQDGSGCRAQVELPEGTPSLEKDAVIQLEVPDFPDTPLRSRRLTRIIPPAKSMKGQP